jgi:enoyl-CoA hydratase/carnithine racemase
MIEGFSTIRYERERDIGTLALARPEKRNAQNPKMWAELAELGAELGADETLRCLVVTGDGPTFSAGIDLVEGVAGLISELAERTRDEDTRATGMAVAGTFSWIAQLGCPSVAAVQGHAYGAGLQLALACDFRVLAEGTKLSLVETRYGVLPDMGATVRLPRIVGEARARELILLGEVIDAAKALQIGLATEVVGEEELGAAAAKLAERVASQPPIALRGARRAIEAAWCRDPEESLRVAVEGEIACLESEDFKEGRQAMVEGRTPQWRGR